MKRIVSLILVVVAVVAGVVLIRQKKQSLSHTVPAVLPAVPVDVASIRAGAVGASTSTVALIRSGTVATVSAQVGGAILEVRYREGDTVRKGDVMARVDARVLEDAVATAEARVAAARQERTRQEAVVSRDTVLVENDALSQQAFEVSQAQLEAARAMAVAAERALGSARTLRSFADVSSPFGGVVTARLVEPGDLASPGKPLYTLMAPGPVKVVSRLSQESLARLSAGGRVTFENAGAKVAARISRIYPALDASHLGTVESDLPSAPFGLATGATLAATYSSTASEGLVVPVAALLQGTSETLLVRVAGGRAEPVRVTVVSDDGREAVVTGEVKAGDLVVTGLPSELMALTAGTAVAPRSR